MNQHLCCSPYWLCSPLVHINNAQCHWNHRNMSTLLSLCCEPVVLFWVQVNPDASFVKMETCSAKAVCEACDVLVVATSLPVDLHI